MGRRRFFGAMAAGVVAGACGSPHVAYPPAMDVATFHSKRRFASTPSGDIAYVEQGRGRVALMLHGVPLNGFHWRHVMAELQGIRRCIALDLMGLGYTRIAPGQDVSFAAQARMVREFLDALGIDEVDLIANDSGGAVAQIFAAGNAKRLRTLTLTNCEAHDNWPPEAIRPSLLAARAGTLIELYERLADDPSSGTAASLARMPTRASSPTTCIAATWTRCAPRRRAAATSTATGFRSTTRRRWPSSRSCASCACRRWWCGDWTIPSST